MSNSDYLEIINSLDSQINELEHLVTNGQFAKNEVTKMFKDNTSSARANGINILYQAVSDVSGKVKGLAELEQLFPSESKVTELKRRFASCGQHLISMINMIEEWD